MKKSVIMLAAVVIAGTLFNSCKNESNKESTLQKPIAQVEEMSVVDATSSTINCS